MVDDMLVVIVECSGVKSVFVCCYRDELMRFVDVDFSVFQYIYDCVDYGLQLCLVCVLF